MLRSFLWVWIQAGASLTSLLVSEDQRVSPATCNLNHSGLQRLDERQGHRGRLQHVVVALIYTKRARRHMNKQQRCSLNNININLLEKHCEMECDTWKKHTLTTYPRANTTRPLLSSIPQTIWDRYIPLQIYKGWIQFMAGYHFSFPNYTLQPLGSFDSQM